MTRSAWIFCLAGLLVVGLGLVPPAALAQQTGTPGSGGSSAAQSNQSQTGTQPSPTSKSAQKGAAGQPSASAMQQQVQSALTADPALAGVTAAANGNVITLTGNVATSADKKRAAKLASQNAAGVKVKNQITVNKGSSGGTGH